MSTTSGGSGTGTTAHPGLGRRIFGLETEYGVTCSFAGHRRLSPDEVARYLFRRVVAWGRSSNVFLRNGARLYLDVGSHPEYATPECDSPRQLVVHDSAGERTLEGLAIDAEQRLAEEGIIAKVYLFKNNTDSAGSSYGCHENYLLTRHVDFGRITSVLLPFLVTRQLLCGAGKVLASPRGTVFTLSQRAEHIWDGVSSATTRSRPIINTRDEPHADAERFRRLHVIVGDSNMSPATTLLKVASTDMVLRLVEQGIPVPDLTLDNPIRAIRTMSADLTGSAKVSLSDGRTVHAREIQHEYLHACRELVRRVGPPDGGTGETAYVLDLWERGLQAVETGDLRLVEKELDWVIKYRLIERYRATHGLPWNSPRIAQLDLSYHDIRRGRGLFWVLLDRGLVRPLIEPLEVFEAKETPPASTRARLRGEFVRRAQLARRDYTVDWVHLKLNDQAQRTVMCKDPFRSHDERVDRLLESL